MELHPPLICLLILNSHPDRSTIATFQAGYAALVPEIFESAPHAAMTIASIGGEDLISAIDNSVLRREVKHACRTLARRNAVNAECNGIRPRLVRPSGFVVDAL